MRSCCICRNKNNLHSFPKNEFKRQLWLSKLNLKRITPHTRICSEHFNTNDFIYESYYTGLVNSRKVLKKDAVPSIQKQCNITIAKGERKKTNLICEYEDNAKDIIVPDFIGDESKSDGNKFIEKETQTLHNYTFGIYKFVEDEAAILFYTGLENYKKIIFVLTTLGPNRLNLQYINKQIIDLSIEDQFFLTLIKLRRNKTIFELSKLFDISCATVLNIFLTWVNFMAVQWDEQNLWPSRDLVNLFMPKKIKTNFPKTRITNETEFPEGKTQLPGVNVLDRKIAQQRIHIDCIIGLTKTYKIITQPLNKQYVALGSSIFYVICMLCNFRKTIVNEDI